MLTRTREPQYGPLLAHEPEPLGLMTGHAWATDPKRFAFTGTRYRYVAKKLEGFREVLEVGCGDAFFSRIVQQHIGNLTAIDFDPAFVEDVHNRMSDDWSFACVVHDMVQAPFKPMHFDGAYALDVLEHIPQEDEDRFLRNFAMSLKANGRAVIGMPSLESQHLASEQSRAGHVNCKSGPQLHSLLKRYFDDVETRPMNDDLVHDGHFGMAHYLMSVCRVPRSCR